MIFPKHIVPGLKTCVLAFLGLVVSSISGSSTLKAQDYFRAKVLDAESLLPVPGVHVMESPQGLRAVSDAFGVFQFEGIQTGKHKLEFSAIGFEKKVISIQLPFSDTLIIPLRSTETLLDEVVVSGTMKEVRLMESPIPVTVISPSFLRKNPAPSLFESLQTVNGVRPQINCSVCNTGDIHINGMEGPYTMVLIDGMPIVSGLASVYGLYGIPTALVERIEIVKGPASSLYGSEAVGGLINVITRSSLKAPRLSVDVMGTNWQEMNIDAGLKLKAGKHFSLLGVNYFNYGNPIDNNGDGFTDLTLQNRISVFNKWDFMRKENRQANLAARYVYEDRWGGQSNWTPYFRGGDSIYAESIYTSRFELIGNYQLALKKEKMFVNFSLSDHQQNSVYGTTVFNARQRIGFVQQRWEKKIGKHELLSGAALRYTYYDDNTVATQSNDSVAAQNKPQITPLPGIFIQDEFAIHQKHLLLGGLRYDHHFTHGPIFSPRISHKWKISDQLMLRTGIGNGFRVVNVFTEDHAALNGSREVIISETLRPERSWNIYSNLLKKLYHRKWLATIEFSVFATHFSNKIIPDYESNDDQIIYSNLNGYAQSKGAAINLEFNYSELIRINVGATFNTIERIESGQKTRPLLTERFSGIFAISWKSSNGKWWADYTGNLIGPMLLPLQENDFRAPESPWFSIQNLQVSRKMGMAWNQYLGVKNLLNFTPPAWSIMRAHDPFDKNADNPQSNPFAYRFDTTYVYSSFQGIRFFIGLRYSLP